MSLNQFFFSFFNKKKFFFSIFRMNSLVQWINWVVFRFRFLFSSCVITSEAKPKLDFNSMAATKWRINFLEKAGFSIVNANQFAFGNLLETLPGTYCSLSGRNSRYQIGRIAHRSAASSRSGCISPRSRTSLSKGGKKRIFLVFCINSVVHAQLSPKTGTSVEGGEDILQHKFFAQRVGRPPPFRGRIS